MLKIYKSRDGHLEQISAERCSEAFWVDMHDPTPEEEQHVERSLQVEVPTREDMREVESSSALYRAHGATFLTVRVVQRDANQQPRLVPLTLIVTRGVFVTLRYTQPKDV